MEEFLTDKEIEEQGKIEVVIYCESCEYEAGKGKLSDIVFKINMHGGYFKYDGVGGSWTSCPICEQDKLISETIN